MAHYHHHQIHNQSHHHHRRHHQSCHHQHNQVIAELMDRHGGYQRPEVADVLWVQVEKTTITITIIVVIVVKIPISRLSGGSLSKASLRLATFQRHLDLEVSSSRGIRDLG